MKLGVRLESFGVPFRQALAHSAKLGIKGAQLDAVGEFHPDRLSETGRREVAFLLRSHGMELTSLRCPMRRPLSDGEQLDARLDGVAKVMALSFDLGARMITLDAGSVPEKEDDPKRTTLKEALAALISQSDRIGSAIALEVGGEPPERLTEFLPQLPPGLIGINFNPANLLVNGFDPVVAVTVLKPLIIHAQAQDARRGGASRLSRSVPLGSGDIDWMSLLGTMSANDYRGWLVITSDEPDAAAMEAGVKFLRRLI